MKAMAIFGYELSRRCSECGECFVKRRVAQLFCCDKHRVRASSKRRYRATRPLLPRKCKTCRTELTTITRASKRYCNDGCRRRYRDQYKLRKHCEEVRPCLCCGVKMNSPRANKVYCSQLCVNRGNKARRASGWEPENRKCVNCDVVFTPKNINSSSCSDKCSITYYSKLASKRSTAIVKKLKESEDVQGIKPAAG